MAEATVELPDEMKGLFDASKLADFTKRLRDGILALIRFHAKSLPLLQASILQYNLMNCHFDFRLTIDFCRRNRLLELPTELREIIYEMAFCGGNSNKLVRDCRSHCKELVNPWLKNMGSLLLVNRQIGAEVSDFLHRKRTAKFCIFSELGTSYDIPDFLAFRKLHLEIRITYNQYCIRYGRKGQGIGASLFRWADELVKHY